MTQLNTGTCGVSWRHDPHGYIVTSAGGTVHWTVLCRGEAHAQQ